jgi:hypothetical protein
MNNNNSTRLMYSYPLLLQAKERGIKRFAPLCKAERVPITIGRGEFM